MIINNDQSDTLLMFSGGLDSTGALWTLLKETEYNIHLHHLHLINKEKRTAAEQQAVVNILSYISKTHKNIKYSESYHQYPTYSYLSKISDGLVLHENFMFDSDIYNFIAGNICMCLPNIKRVAIGRTKSDDNPEVRERATRGDKLLKLFSPNVQKIYPVEHLTKSEIYNMLPEELRNITWSCRTPVVVDNNTIEECGQCKTCKDLSRIRHGV